MSDAPLFERNSVVSSKFRANRKMDNENNGEMEFMITTEE